MKTLEFGDMVFYAITGLVVILLLWLRFLEESVGLWGAWALWAGWFAFLVASYLRARRAKASKTRRSGGQVVLQPGKGGMGNGNQQA